MRGLLVGRFQPFHRGHLAVVRELRTARPAAPLLIGIGSAEESYTWKNPFTAGERFEMIVRALDEAEIGGVEVVPIADIRRHALWVAYLEALLPSFDRVYTNNPLTRVLFERAGYNVESPTLVDRRRFEGKRIRARLAVGRGWQELLPPAVARYLATISAPERLRLLRGGFGGARDPPGPMTSEEPSSSAGAVPRRRFEPLPEWVGPSTRLVHGARRPELNAGAVVPPIYQTSTFHWPAAHSESAERSAAYLYTRTDNPTIELPTETVRQLEGGEAARLFGSGMGAITASVLSLLKAGDEVVALESLYGGTTDLLTDLLPRYGVTVREVPDAVAREPHRAVGTGTRLVVIESPTNPTLRVHDICRWADAAHRVGAVLLVDNTFATPINQNPLALGADLVVHSATKYLGGHSDLVAGIVVGAEHLVERIDAKGYLGSTADPLGAFLLARGLKTLALRVARQNENAFRVAEAIRDHRAVARVHYPGWSDDAEDAIARRQMRGRGGLVSISLEGGAAAVEPFLFQLRFVHVAASLGGVESLVSVPRQTSHRHLDASQRTSRGIDDGLVRLSFGIEDPADLVRDVTEALDHVA